MDTKKSPDQIGRDFFVAFEGLVALLHHPHLYAGWHDGGAVFERN